MTVGKSRPGASAAAGSPGEREVRLGDGEIWSGHMKGPALAQEEALSNSIGYYYRRRLNQSLKNTQTVFPQFAGTAREEIDIKRLVGYLWEKQSGKVR